MKKLNTLLFVLLAGSAFAQTNWGIDKNHSKIGFAVPHYAITEVEGNFRQFDAMVVSKSDDFDGADVTFTAVTGSIDTDNENRDKHLKSPDFFDAEKFPEVSFKGKLSKSGGKYKLKGDLTMRGVTKPAEFDVTFGGTAKTDKGGMKAGFKITGEVDRTQYGIAYGAGGAVIGDKVNIIAKIELDKKA